MTTLLDRQAMSAPRMIHLRSAGVAIALGLAVTAGGSPTVSASVPTQSTPVGPTVAATPSAITVPRKTITLAAVASGPRLSSIRVVVALGDSVPYGTRCGCTPYPQDSAADLATAIHARIRTYNDSVPGYRTSGVLGQLLSNPAAMAHVRAANLVEIEIGANDISYGSGCGSSVACYRPRSSQAMTNLGRIVARVRQLRAGRPTTIVLLGYWSVWLGGRYATQRGTAYVNAAAALTRAENTAILGIARRTGSLYVDLRTAFRGPNDAYDETHLLASDGDHPNAAGHARIGQALTQVLRARLPR